ncbi:MAG: acetate/propionate family kinase [Candidatus Kerfeldbacteria bacterium]|nr:acetate/propionate family kinase [Candidatus Kerfeldbacteria bacterium]
MPNASYILVLNAGSATLKWALFEPESLLEIGRGVCERIGAGGSFAEWRLRGKPSVKNIALANHSAALGYVLKLLAWHKIDLNLVTIVGHRVVHGGIKFNSATVLTASVIKQLSRYNSLAPLHNPVQLEVTISAKRFLPRARHLAVFDTAWFAGLPEQAREYALPQALVKKYGLRRFGFHGISHSLVARQASRKLQKPLEVLNLITCHLGSGCSLTAVRAGRAVDTSMGFTPLEGLVMGTRGGDIDPGVIIYLLKQNRLSLNKLDELLQKESGLKGVSGVADMREVLVRAGYEVLGFKAIGRVSAAEKKQARLALKVFLYRVQKYIGAYAAILGRVDAIVFTGGIGERNEVVRNLIMNGLPTLKTIPVLVIPTNEELAIVREVSVK